MKRTSPWVFVAGAMVQLAGLGLCVWAMERWVRDADDDAGLTQRPALAPAPPVPAPAAARIAANTPLEPAVDAPRFVPPPAAQVFSGNIGGRSLTFTLCRDGKVTFVDVDGSRYTGTTESARVRMREVGGMRAFTVRLETVGAGRLQATFTGGAHDNATIALDEHVARSIV